jgi:hypothetical protein
MLVMLVVSVIALLKRHKEKHISGFWSKNFLKGSLSLTKGTCKAKRLPPKEQPLDYPKL